MACNDTFSQPRLWLLNRNLECAPAPTYTVPPLLGRVASSTRWSCHL